MTDPHPPRRLLIFVVAYYAEWTVRRVLEHIPPAMHLHLLAVGVNRWKMIRRS